MTVIKIENITKKFGDSPTAVIALDHITVGVNTLAINVIERTHEIGMLRALGSSRGMDDPARKPAAGNPRHWSGYPDRPVDGLRAGGRNVRRQFCDAVRIPLSGDTH